MITTMFSPVSLEAQKLISVSIGKINASRVTRTGSSLHKSLLVASVLQRARNVYLDEERERAMRSFPQSTAPQEEVTLTPVVLPPPPSNTNSDFSAEDNRVECFDEDRVATPDCLNESRLPLVEANMGNFSSTLNCAPAKNITSSTVAGNNVTNTTTTVTSSSVTNTVTVTTSSSRKRRRVSDQETAAAVSSILPKRLRSELKEETTNIIYTSEGSLKEDRSEEDTSIYNSYNNLSSENPEEETRLNENSETEENASTSQQEDSVQNYSSDSLEDNSQTSLSDSDDSEGDDSASDTSTGSNSGDEMEVDQLTSLVSFFSFSKSQNKSDFCLGPIPQSQIVALTA